MTANIAHLDARISSAEFEAHQAGSAAITLCPYCGYPDAEPFRVLSTHGTSAGQTVWTRCRCGSLQTRLRDAAGERITVRSRPRHAIG